MREEDEGTRRISECAHGHPTIQSKNSLHEALSFGADSQEYKEARVLLLSHRYEFYCTSGCVGPRGFP